MDDLIQDELNFNLNTISQTVLDVTVDWLVSNQIMSRISNDLKLNMTTSVIFHVLDEIVFGAVMDEIRKYIRDVPLVGDWVAGKLIAVSSRPYVKTLVQIITILMLQKYTHDVDIIELTVIMLNTYFVDYAVEVRAISDILDTRLDF